MTAREIAIAKGWLVPGAHVAGMTHVGWVEYPATLRLDDIGRKEATKTIADPTLHRRPVDFDQRPDVTR